MCVIPNNLMRACQEPACKAVFTRRHTWENMNYCPVHRADISELDRPGQCVVTVGVHRSHIVTSTQAGFLERFMS